MTMYAFKLIRVIVKAQTTLLGTFNVVLRQSYDSYITYFLLAAQTFAAVLFQVDSPPIVSVRVVILEKTILYSIQFRRRMIMTDLFVCTTCARFVVFYMAELRR